MNTLFALVMTSLVHLIPAPVSLEPGEGFFTLNNQTQLFLTREASMAGGAALYFSETVKPSMGINPAFSKSRPLENAMLAQQVASAPECRVCANPVHFIDKFVV